MTMMFMVPKKFKKKPSRNQKNSKIKFKQVPKKTVAAISFGGWANDKKIEKYKTKTNHSSQDKGNYTYK